MTCWTGLAVDDCAGCAGFVANAWRAAKCGREAVAAEAAAISAIKMNSVIRRRIGNCLREVVEYSSWRGVRITSGRHKASGHPGPTSIGRDLSYGGIVSGEPSRTASLFSASRIWRERVGHARMAERTPRVKKLWMRDSSTTRRKRRSRFRSCARIAGRRVHFRCAGWFGRRRRSRRVAATKRIARNLRRHGRIWCA